MLTSISVSTYHSALRLLDAVLYDAQTDAEKLWEKENPEPDFPTDLDNEAKVQARKERGSWYDRREAAGDANPEVMRLKALRAELLSHATVAVEGILDAGRRDKARGE